MQNIRTDGHAKARFNENVTILGISRKANYFEMLLKPDGCTFAASKTLNNLNDDEQENDSGHHGAAYGRNRPSD